MRKIELDELEILRAVVTEGGVARAAQTLHRAPSNVTTRIKQPEDRLGVALFSGIGMHAIRNASDVGRARLIAFANGCSYRERLEDWLGDANVLPERVLEFGSYPAIVACVAAGTGLAIVPHSVLSALNAASEIRPHPLPAAISRNRTHLLCHPGIETRALQGLRTLLPASPLTFDSNGHAANEA